MRMSLASSILVTFSVTTIMVVEGFSHIKPASTGFTQSHSSPISLPTQTSLSSHISSNATPICPSYDRSSSRLHLSSAAVNANEDGKENNEGGGSSGNGYLLRETSILTPNGYGFASTAKRILESSDRMGGYYTARASDRVIDVMDGITDGVLDVALVYDKDALSSADDDSLPMNGLVGLFTESDYVDFSTERGRSTSEADSAKFLISPVSDHVTSVDNLVGIATTDTANKAIALMQTNKIRHLVVADNVTSDNRLSSQSVIQGVINIQDVMSIVQKDERLSIDNLQQKFPGFKDPMSQMREAIKSQANLLAKEPETVKRDVTILKVGTALLSSFFIGGFFVGGDWLHANSELAMIAIFVLGYIAIIFEEVFEFNKGAVALLMSTGMWVTYADFFGSSSGTASPEVIEQLGEQLSEVSDICFFLLAASTIVEVIDAHQGFKVITNLIQTKSKKGLFWTIGVLTFFLSAILNNLTVTIVMVSLLRKLVPNEDDRKLFGAMVVVAANAGGVWTPIGDVTTTMLWINNQLSTLPTVTELFIPSVVCLVGSLAFLVNQVEEDDSLENSTLPEPSTLAPRGQLVFWSGIACLLSVPVFSEFTGLPPYIAMLTGLGAIWTLTDILHMDDEKSDTNLQVPAALSKLDTSGILFFLGILMSIGVLDKSGLLKQLAVFLNDTLPSQDIIATVIGIASALIDNVPLVAATMGMYDLADYGTDDKLWQLIALCAGTGGSILVIGSASGVALMGLEKVDFLWYAKKVSVGAAVGYFAGIAAYLAQNAILHGNLLG
mmetsp:Transcript_15841/g.22554  ORF Transcript_15841/g.22554 Transcript_15841/m.22554 type:complete len:783 (+) Transcript_15841:77-2425(+)